MTMIASIPQATSKARVQNLTSSAKTAQVIESYDKLGLFTYAYIFLGYICVSSLPPLCPISTSSLPYLYLLSALSLHPSVDHTQY